MRFISIHKSTRDMEAGAPPSEKLLAGMGPVATLTSDGAKIFAGLYAIYCSVVFVATVGLVLAPVVAHVLRRFHLEQS